MNLLKKIKGALDHLPFDGNKTTLSGASTIFGLIGLLDPSLIPAGVDPMTWVIGSVIGMGIGALHKWLKKKYPEIQVNYPRS